MIPAITGLRVYVKETEIMQVSFILCPHFPNICCSNIFFYPKFTDQIKNSIMTCEHPPAESFQVHTNLCKVTQMAIQLYLSSCSKGLCSVLSINALSITATIFQALLVKMCSSNVEKPEKKKVSIQRDEGDGTQRIRRDLSMSAPHDTAKLLLGS